MGREVFLSMVYMIKKGLEKYNLGVSKYIESSECPRKRTVDRARKPS